MMSRGTGQWYVRARGRVLGPFDHSQLVSLRDRGRLSQDDEVSLDRRSWMKAAEVPGVYAKAADTKAQPPSGADADWPVIALDEDSGPGQVWAAADAEASWFVARGDSHQGPMGHSDVQRLISSGDIGPSSLVWKQGMPAWLPASQVPELRIEAASGRAAGALSPFVLPPRTSGLAVASLVFGLLWLCGFGSLLATISGAMALRQIARSNGAISGKGLALAGIILGFFGLSASLVLSIIFGLAGMNAPQR
jgi:hypothetical protein